MTEQHNHDKLLNDLDAIEELRDAALVRMAAQQQVVARSFNKNVQAKSFVEGDWVLRKVFQNTKLPNASKFGPKWEGPYQIIKAVGNGAYQLTQHDGSMVPRSWNVVHLKDTFFS